LPERRKQKIVFLLPSLHGGGAERAAITLLGALSETYDLTLYLFEPHGAYLESVPPGVRTVIGQSGRMSRVLALRRFVEQEQSDVVVSFLSHFSGFVALRGLRPRPRYLVSQQTPVSGFLQDADYRWRRPLNRRLFSLVARSIFPRVDLVAATSQGVAEDLVQNFGVRRERIEIVHNPVDVETVQARATEAIETAPRAHRVPRIVTAGRLADAKNLPLLVASLEQVAKQTAVDAWVLGEGELEQDLRQRLANAGLTEHVQLLGFQSNPWKYMARADVFVLTSRYEGFGNVLIEAMACGLPVVATASYGTREIVQHERNGLLVESHTPEAVASALTRLLTDEALRKQLAFGARESAHRFSVARVAERFKAVVTRAVGEPVQ
jgi:glycosyltransferase involved in cell wall biosynthesis